MYRVLTRVDGELDHKELAKMLDGVDRTFVKSLRMSDFFRVPDQSSVWKANFKVLKYVEYQKALYQVLRQFVMAKHEPEESNGLESPKGSIHSGM